ncbi:hypothetical protein Aca07nite_26720 [Actinoplanes capillaceus]|uniref:Uncharacterized protein n=1 Tax=Actinoplanes campanulatus TaxID=113559 RepID=A0ABQ3WGN8_9ACTN|nr:hypothetical protein Aca07nite_26720 [Actinoplanes capillaceus]
MVSETSEPRQASAAPVERVRERLRDAAYSRAQGTVTARDLTLVTAKLYVYETSP